MFGFDAGLADSVASGLGVATGVGVGAAMLVSSEFTEGSDVVIGFGVPDVVELVSAWLPCADTAVAVESFACVFADADGSLEVELAAASSVLETLSADGGFIVG